MQGLMQDWPLTTHSILRRGLDLFGTRTVTTRRVDGLSTMTFGELGAKARRLAGVLDGLELSAPDARVGTFSWNTGEHMVAYYGVPSAGYVLHTINVRLFADQLVFTITDAADEVILLDRSLIPLFAPHLPRLDCVRHVLVHDDGAAHELPDDPRVRWYDEVAAAATDAELEGRVTDENTAAAMCYTTGTTGNPKGVVYSHRSTWLHASAGTTSVTLGVNDRDTFLPVVPMFHAMAWGYPYTCMLAGSNVVMPGPDLTPDGLLDLVQSQRVTLAAGVPTIWMGMLPRLGEYDVASLRAVMCGGSAVPRSLSEGWRAAIDRPITQGWGMTEISPVGSMSSLRAEYIDADDDTKARIRATQGMPLPGVEMRIVEAETRALLPWDDEAAGELEIRGPWVARQYYHTDEPGEQFSSDGWLRTGDVAAISPLGYIRLVDRTKDLVKSGGEWISSVDLENTIMGHPAVAEAAVIAMPHPKWMERPLACVVLKPEQTLTLEDVRSFLAEAGVSKWSMPDDLVVLAELPKTSVGKFSKRILRDRLAEHRLPQES